MKAKKRFSSGILSRILGLETEVENIKQSFQDGCSTIASAISDMGVAAAYNDSPEIMAENIRNIQQTSDVSATAIYKSSTANDAFISSFNVKAKTLYIMYVCETASDYGILNIDTSANKTILSENNIVAETGKMFYGAYLYEGSGKTSFNISVNNGKSCTKACLLVSYK